MDTEQEKNKRQMQELMERPGNSSCVDCGAAGNGPNNSPSVNVLYRSHTGR